MTLCATLLGQRAGNTLAFVKTYEPTVGYRAEVRYDGTVSADVTEIEGRWVIHPEWCGRFPMIRSQPHAEKVARKRFARV
jgi:hypothetical protein